MAQTFEEPPATPRESINIVKVRDEISRLSQRLTRARQSYESDLARGEGDVPLDMQLATIEGYTSKLEVLHEQLRLHEGGPAPQTVPQPAVPTAVQPAIPTAVQTAVPTVPQPAAQPFAQPDVQPFPQPFAQPDVPPFPQPEAQPVQQAAPVGSPLPHRSPPQHLAPAPQQLAPAPQHLAPAPAPAPHTVFQPEPEPAPFEPPTFSGRSFDTNGNTLISDATLRSEEVATGEYVRLAAEQRWLESHRPSLVSEYMAACDLILEALAHVHGTTPQAERDRLVRHVDARFRRDYG